MPPCLFQDGYLVPRGCRSCQFLETMSPKFGRGCDFHIFFQWRESTVQELSVSRKILDVKDGQNDRWSTYRDAGRLSVNLSGNKKAVKWCCWRFIGVLSFLGGHFVDLVSQIQIVN